MDDGDEGGSLAGHDGWFAAQGRDAGPRAAFEGLFTVVYGVTMREVAWSVR